jgi:hypothetical protein
MANAARLDRAVPRAMLLLPVLNQQMTINAFRRSITAVAIIGLASSVAARPQTTKGITYRIRVSSRLPAIMGGAGGDGPLVLARASAVGNRARFDMLAFQPMPQDMSLDDYLLVLDSARAVFVSADKKIYADASNMLRSGGLGILASMAVGRRGSGGAVPQMEMSNLVTDFELVGRDTTDGKPTQHYRVVAEMTVAAMGRQVPLRIVVDTWAADLPYHIVNPFDGSSTVSPDDPAAKLAAKLLEYRKKIQGTPIKTVTATTLTVDAGGGPMMLDFGQTTQITDIKEADVDEKQLEIPTGYTKKP